MGGTTTLSFSINKAGAAATQSGIGFTDTLPSGLVVAATPNIQTNCPAGGGFAAFVNGAREDIARSALTSLHDIRDRAACRMRLPAGPPPETLEIAFSDGTTQLVTRVANADACSGATFYLDDAGANATLCSGGPLGGLCEITFLRARDLGVQRAEEAVEVGFDARGVPLQVLRDAAPARQLAQLARRRIAHRAVV